MNNKEEIWKDIPNYEGLYQASNLGRIKSFAYNRETILKQFIDKHGYFRISLTKKGVKSTKKVHQIIAITFLNHKPCGHKYVVNHKNFIRNDNRLSNLEIVTSRDNNNKKHLESTSKYVGVSFKKSTKRWLATITIKGKQKHLGYYDTEEEASLAYQKALKEL